MNTSKDKGKTHRAALFEDTLEVIRAVGHDYVFIENVPQWLASRPEAARSILGEKLSGNMLSGSLKI